MKYNNKDLYLCYDFNFDKLSLIKISYCLIFLMRFFNYLI